MYIEDLDEVSSLRNRLLKYEKLHKAAESGSMGDFHIWYGGDQIEVFSIISAEPLRRAIMATCSNEIAETKGKLGDLGVNTSQKLTRAA